VPTDGRHVAAVVQSPDLLPTIVELLGLPVPAQVTGASALPALRGGTPAPRESWFEARFETYRALTPKADVGPKVAARDDRFMALLRLGPGRLEIYDRLADPGEVHDLAAGLPAGGPDAALRAALEQALRARSDAAREGLRRAPPVLAPATHAALEALVSRRP